MRTTSFKTFTSILTFMILTGLAPHSWAHQVPMPYEEGGVVRAFDRITSQIFFVPDWPAGRFWVVDVPDDALFLENGHRVGRHALKAGTPVRLYYHKPFLGGRLLSKVEWGRGIPATSGMKMVAVSDLWRNIHAQFEVLSLSIGEKHLDQVLTPASQLRETVKSLAALGPAPLDKGGKTKEQSRAVADRTTRLEAAVAKGDPKRLSAAQKDLTKDLRKLALLYPIEWRLPTGMIAPTTSPSAKPNR